MRTAQSVPSTTSRRPVAKRLPLTYRSIGVVGLAVELDDRARRQADDLREGMRARPSSAHTRTGMPASEGRRTDRRRRRSLRGAAGAGGTIGPDVVERARHAHHEGVRHELDEPARLAADRERRRTACGVAA